LARVVELRNGQALIAFRDAELVGVTDVGLLAREGSRPDYRLIRLGAAGARYLNSKFRLQVDLRQVRGDLPPEVSTAIAMAIPLAAGWVRYEGDAADYAVYSGDLARALGDDPVAVTREHRGSARSTRVSDPPCRGGGHCSSED